MIFIDKNMVITTIQHSCMPCNSEWREQNCPNYSGFGNFVIEVEGGTCKRLNIMENQEIKVLN